MKPGVTKPLAKLLAETINNQIYNGYPYEYSGSFLGPGRRAGAH